MGVAGIEPEPEPGASRGDPIPQAGAEDVPDDWFAEAPAEVAVRGTENPAGEPVDAGTAGELEREAPTRVAPVTEVGAWTEGADSLAALLFDAAASGGRQTAGRRTRRCVGSKVKKKRGFQ